MKTVFVSRWPRYKKRLQYSALCSAICISKLTLPYGDLNYIQRISQAQLAIADAKEQSRIRATLPQPPPPPRFRMFYPTVRMAEYVKVVANKWMQSLLSETIKEHNQHAQHVTAPSEADPTTPANEQGDVKESKTAEENSRADHAPARRKSIHTGVNRRSKEGPLPSEARARLRRSSQGSTAGAGSGVSGRRQSTSAEMKPSPLRITVTGSSRRL